MPIDFSPGRWEHVKQVYRAWWAGELDRPILPACLFGCDPGRDEPSTPPLNQATCTDFSIRPEDFIDRMDYGLSKYKFLGDAFPQVDLAGFGPGVMAAFVGAHVELNDGHVWFQPPRDVSISELHLEYDPNNIWLRRVKDIYAAGMERWGGLVLMGMTDLGGTLDILSTFLPGKKLLFALCDHPEEVKRLTWEIHELWHRFYGELDAILQPDSPGRSDWSAVFSEETYYILQCDFCYMIGPDMFDEFVKPELTASCRQLGHSIYHLDGVGQLPHLDSLLSIEELDGVQWVAGSGAPGERDWPEVFQRIHAAGKKIQFFGSYAYLDALMGYIGTGKGIVSGPNSDPIEKEAEVRKRLAKLGVE